MPSVKVIVLSIFGLFVLLGCLVFGYFISSTDEHSKQLNQNPRLVYREDYWRQSSSFLREAFETIPHSPTGSVGLVLRGDVAEHDLLYPLDKGYDVIIEDSQSIYFYLMPPTHEKYQMKMKIITGRVDFDALPALDLVMTNVALPHYPPQEFKAIWQTLQKKTKPGAYFIGNFMGHEGSVLKKSTVKDDDYSVEMTFMTKNEILQLFKGWKILKINEVKTEHPAPLGTVHSYEVFAKKVQP